MVDVRRLMGLWIATLTIATVPAAAIAAGPVIYDGICEASAAVALDADHFVVASDETNDLYLYKRGEPAWTIVNNVTGHDKSDIEAATRIGDRIYWLSSHSFNSDHEDKPKRKIFFAMDASGEHALSPILHGQVFRKLREAMPEAIRDQPGVLNIEGMTSTLDGRLILGLRSPLAGNDETPAADRHAYILVVDAPPEEMKEDWQPAINSTAIRLNGLGIRSLEHIGRNGIEYLVVAGPVSGGGSFALYKWEGPGSTTDPVKVYDFPANFRAEAMIFYPDKGVVQILSDDGDGIDGRVDQGECQDRKMPSSERHFRSIDWPLPAQ